MGKDRQIAIKDKYMQLIIDLGCDYDGWNDVDHLKGLIDELVSYARYGIECNDKQVMFRGLDNSAYNILDEEIDFDNKE